MSSLAHRLKRGWRRAGEILAAQRAGGGRCWHCGFTGKPRTGRVLWPELVAQWDLSPRWQAWMDAREGDGCVRCGASLRSSQLAQALVGEMERLTGAPHRTLRAACADRRVQRLRIAEINSAGNLHRTLARCSGLRYSEFGSRDPAVPSEDLTKLTYADASFDLATTSDTMEHVPDVDAAFQEVLRILRPGGAYVFSIPVVWDRGTRQRAKVVNGAVEHALPPSFHGAAQGDAQDMLVFHEFGGDIVDRCRGHGFDLSLLKDAQNPALVTFVARKPAG